MSRFLLVLLAGILAGCTNSSAGPLSTLSTSSPTPPLPISLLKFHVTNYHLKAWSNISGPFANIPIPDGPRDNTGVRILIANGKPYQQPTVQAQDAAAALVRYATGKKGSDLDLAEKDAQRIIDNHRIAATSNDAWWFPYSVSYAEYQDPNDMAIAPWYSGMGQGEALFVFTRLYEITGDASWKIAAQHTFSSFLYPIRAGESPTSYPWAVQVDNKGYLWIEEYPTPNPNDDTINGFGFALFGLIEYARYFNSVEATLLADAGLTTFLYGATTVRHPGGVSSYSLSHLGKRYTGYHKIVTTQLAIFGGVTGNAQFTTLSQEFYQDYQ